MSNYHISFGVKESPGEDLTLDTLAIKKPH